MQESLPDGAPCHFCALHVWRHLFVPHELAAPHYPVVRPDQQYVRLTCVRVYGGGRRRRGFAGHKKIEADSKHSYCINLHLHRPAHSHAQ